MALRGFHEFYGLLGGGINFFTKQCGWDLVDYPKDKMIFVI